MDFAGRTIRVDQQLVYVSGSRPVLGPPKTNESIRTVPLPEFAAVQLAALLVERPADPGALIFTAERGGPLLRTTVHSKWRRLLAKTGIDPDTHFHHLRHHYASVLIDGGESVKVVQERLGHASAEETLRTYAHLMPTNEQRTRSVVEDAWKRG